MKMLLVETLGRFMLLDPNNLVEIRSKGYTVVPFTNFVDAMRGDRLTVIAELKDTATDAEWRNYVTESDGDLELAKASFLSSFGKDAEPQLPIPAPRKGRK
jgi:hypothetical protein